MNPPQQFNFRLRVNFSASHRVHADADEVPLMTLESGASIRAKSGIPKIPIKDAERVAIIGGPFESEGAARSAGARAKDAVLLWAIEHRVGLDFGDGVPRGLATAEGLKLLSQEHGVPVRNDLHGLDVYVADGKTKFAFVAATAMAGKNTQAFAETFAKHFESPQRPPARPAFAAELYFSSWFDVSPRSRFITLMTAVEALIEPGPREVEAQGLVDLMMLEVDKTTLPISVRDSMKGALSWLRSESIGHAGKRMADGLLAGETFRGLTPGAFFRHAYNIRSKVVHRGLADGKLMMDMANAMEEFVSKLIRAAFSGAPSPNPKRPRVLQRLRAAWLAFRDA